MKKSNQISKIKFQHREIRFLLLFFLFFILFQIAQYIARPYTTPFLVHTLSAGVSSKLINMITPDEKTFSEQEYIVSGTFKLKIAQGCEGTEGIFILVAAILAFPAGLRAKIFGIIGGIFVLYGLNLVRIAGLYYILKKKPLLFDVMHVYIGQTMIILIAFIYFVGWLNLQMNANEENS